MTGFGVRVDAMVDRAVRAGVPVFAIMGWKYVGAGEGRGVPDAARLRTTLERLVANALEGEDGHTYSSGRWHVTRVEDDGGVSLEVDLRVADVVVSGGAG